MVKIYHSEVPLELDFGGGLWDVDDALLLGGQRPNSRRGDFLPQVFHGSLAQDAFGGVYSHPVVSELDQHFPQVLLMFNFVATGNENVVQIDENETEIPEYLVHQALKSLRAVFHAERHPQVFEQPEGGYDCRLLDIRRVHGDLMIPALSKAWRAQASLSGQRRRALAKTGAPRVGTECITPCALRWLPNLGC